MADAGESPGEMVVLERRSNTPGVNPKTTDHNQKTPFLKKPIEGQLPTWPGDYELQLLTLTPPNREGYIGGKKQSPIQDKLLEAGFQKDELSELMEKYADRPRPNLFMMINQAFRGGGT